MLGLFSERPFSRHKAPGLLASWTCPSHARALRATPGHQHFSFLNSTTCQASSSGPKMSNKLCSFVTSVRFN